MEKINPSHLTVAQADGNQSLHPEAVDELPN